MQFKDALEAWIKYRRRMVDLDLVAVSTWNNQTKIAATIAAGIGEHELEALRKSHIELWVGDRLRTCCPVTVRGELNIVRQVLNWCVDEQLLAAKPRLPTVKVPSTELELPTDDAFRWVLGNLPSQHSEALQFMMLTGLSPHELERLQRRDECAGGIGIGQRPDFHVKQASRRRVVPLNRQARAIWRKLTVHLPGHIAPFPTVAAMGKAIQRLRSSEARPLFPPPPGVDRITPKTMRSWFASKVSNGQPEHVLQRLMGHAPGSPITRRHYVRSSEEQMGAAVNDLRLVA